MNEKVVVIFSIFFDNDYREKKILNNKVNIYYRFFKYNMIRIYIEINILYEFL